MPNWCANTLEITHSDPEMIARVRKSFVENSLLNEFVPVPQDLKITAGFLGNGAEQQALEEQQTRNLATYGYTNWYEFCVSEWGTKWDIGGTTDQVQDIPNGVILTFDSAWSPPVNAYDKLLDLGFEIRAMYYEPGMGYAGVWDNGSDDCYEYGGMTSAAIAEFLPVELNEAYGISDAIAEWEVDQEVVDI